jgi:PAS domain S-box-containing protein
VVSRGEEVLDETSTHQPDLVLMDVMLRGKVDGVQAARQIHQRFRTPVVYLTAYADTETLSRAKETEPFGYVVKPFTGESLETAIEVALLKCRMQRKLQEGYDWYDTTLQSIGDAVIATDRKGNVRFMNKAAERVTGHRHRDAMGKPSGEVLQVISDTGQPGMLDPVGDVLRNKKAIKLDRMLLIDRQGNRRRVGDSASPIINERGDVDGAVLVFQDLSSETGVEANPRKQLILDTLQEMIFYQDPQLRILWCNRATVQHLDMPRREILGLMCYQALYDLDEPCPGCPALEALKTHRPCQRELATPRQQVWRIGCTPVLSEDDAVIGLVTSGIDITEKKQSEDKQRRREEHISRMLDAVHAAIMVQVEGKGVRFVNDRACELLGVERDKLIGLNIEEYDWRAIHEDGSPLPPEDYPIHTTLRTEMPVENLVVGVPAEGDTVRWLLISTELIPGEQPDGREVVVSFDDITELRKIQDHRRKLEDRVRQSEHLEGLGLLAGGVAHDFNNLLMAMVGNADLGLMDTPAESPAHESFLEIKQAAMRAAELTEQMLAYSGQANVKPAELQINDLVVEFCESMERSLPEHIRIETQLDKTVSTISADRSRLRHVLMNLVMNAAESLDGMRGTITIRTGLAELNQDQVSHAYLFETFREGPAVLLEVRDTGAGMDEDTMRRAFDPFFTTKFTGRGLGLAAVQGIVRAHHGAICLDSQPGKGTTVRVFLPAGRESVPRGSRVARPARPWVGEGVALVVDDEKGVQRVARLMLEKAGFEVLAAGTISAGLDRLRRRADDVDIVFLDMTMPGCDCADSIRWLREIRPDLHIVLMSGYAPQMIARRMSGEHRPDEFLQKPFGLDSLAECARRAIVDGRD